MKIAMFAKGARAVACLDALMAAGHKPLAILIEDNDPTFRARVKEAGIMLLDREDELLTMDLDLLILASYTKIVRSPIFKHPRLGTINLHGGKLPDYRGASVINWQIIQGESKGGVAVVVVDDGIDTGDILAEAMYDIGPDETIAEVQEKVVALFPPLLVGVVERFDRGDTSGRRQQPHEGAYWHKRRADDGMIDWRSLSDKKVHDLVRSLVRPYPGAFSYLGGRKVYIWKTELLAPTFSGLAGRIVRGYGGGHVVIAANRGILVRDFSFENADEEESRRIMREHIGKSFGNI